MLDHLGRWFSIEGRKEVIVPCKEVIVPCSEPVLFGLARRLGSGASLATNGMEHR